MQRLLLLILCLCSVWAAQAQVSYDWRYWFDQSPTYEQGSSVGILQLDVDVSGLSKTLHQIHVQVRDTAGMFSEPVTRYFFVPDDGSPEGHKLYCWFDQNSADLQSFDQAKGLFDLDISAKTPGIHSVHFFVTNGNGEKSELVTRYFYVPEARQGKVSLCYWYDQNEASLHTTNQVSGLFDLDVSALSPGIHTIHFFTKDESGKSSEPVCRCFVKPDSIGSNLMWRYWFDDAITQSVILPGTTTSQMIDVDSLSDGLHYIHLQAMDASFSETKTQMFIKVPNMQNLTEVICLVLVDNALFSKETINMKGGNVTNLNLDVEELTPGLHKLDVFVMTPSGVMSRSYNAFFIKENYQDERGAMRCFYIFDNENTVHETTYSEGVSHINIDVAQLEDGLHTVRWMLADKAGAYVSDKRSWFFKTPLGGNTITKYAYWVNDADSLMHEKVLDTPKSPYDLIALLPVETMPLRSSSFHFENKDNQPMMYAKNDIHFTFTDRFDRETNISKQYVDYNTSAAITDFAQLKQTQTFTRPDENRIKWFRFEAAPGDTIAFRSSQATSLQVFAPSGKEILTTMGDKSVQYTGAHTWEEGTYYVAVHDVTGSKPSVTLDYMHMDKYDVVSQDVRVVGNGGCSTITFQGNGFRDLYAVDLKDSKGNIIESIDVGHESDAETTVTFDFTGAKLGKYNAVFHFTEDDKTITNSITVEEAKEIELINSVTYNGTFLLGREAEFTLKIVNNSNMTAYSVPVQIEVRSGKSLEDIKNIKVACDRFSAPEFILSNDSIDPVIQDVLKDELPKLGTLSDFFVLKDGNGQLYYHAEYSMSLLPNSETVITTSVNSRLSTEVYYIVPSDWAALSMKPINNARRMARAQGLDAICCNKERIKCVANIANLIGGFTPYGCATSIGNEIVEQTLEGMCPDEGQVKQSLNKKVKSIAGSIMNVLIDCVTGHFDDLAKGIRKALKGIEEQIGNVSKQIAKLSQERDEAYQSFRYLRTKATEAFNNHDADAYKIWMDQADEAFKKGQSLDNEIAGLSKQKDDLLTQQASKNKELFDCREGLSNAIKGIRDSMADMFTESSCYKAFKESKSNCPPPYPGGGSSTPVNSYDPNDIYGYIASSGSMYVGDDVLNMPYRIEFENDTTFATSAALTVVVKDTLDATKFDLASYQPTSIKIGDKSVQLKGDKTFVTTVDMRPAINAIAQVEGKYDEKKGIATWTFTSLDPMTMEPTDDIMQGFLPVNYDGSGIGELAYNINRKAGLSDGTAISNKASIVFDNNDAIETPTWMNIIDATPPITHVNEVELVNDTIVRVHFDGEDNRSGVWKYALYVQYGENTAWNQIAETDTTCFDFRFYEDINYGFCVVATDMAGNVEKKIIQREYKFLNGEGEMIDGISSPKADQVATNRAYDLSGRLIQEEGYRGIVIKNRKKLLKR